MKEFEKWWSEQLCSNNDKYKTIAYCVWKAALGWALSNETSIAYSIPVVSADIIRKELDEN
ncbi:hypothetical protein LCGC14_0423140 [marine sediment metagenome]|uniref:Uncharacterized protein n=1 Tax=marine sediment metagenome TaxID=412755 RepID=A0A0F9VCJ6_9ZZZZ